MVLYTNAPWISEALEYAQPATVLQRAAELAPDGVTGELRPRGGDRLKQSQTYTKEFGLALANTFARHRKHWRKTPPVKVCKCTSCPKGYDLVVQPPTASEDMWHDARAFEVLSSARVAALSVLPNTLVESATQLD